MTPELLEFRKWQVVAELIETFTEHMMEPVVLNTGGISLLLIHKDKAFFFSSCSEGRIVVDTWIADGDERIGSEWLFPLTQPKITFREIAHAMIAKTLTIL